MWVGRLIDDDRRWKVGVVIVIVGGSGSSGSGGGGGGEGWKLVERHAVFLLSILEDVITGVLSGNRGRLVRHTSFTHDVIVVDNDDDEDNDNEIDDENQRVRRK
uniref:Uncharacterized protein n=1 Tax=Vespula pensylvanica TaxID=30213 RepID=A0A834UDJ0_VESPE|nr:hypothetical protein H0235_005045 [Vespula pensylvanica]